MRKTRVIARLDVKGPCPKIYNLDLNTEQLKFMGGKYIFSAIEIVNAEENDLYLLKVFDDNIWEIWLYGVST